MLFYKKSDYYSSNLEINIEKLNNGDFRFLPLIFCVFAENSPKHKLRASQVLAEILSSISVDGICRVDLQMRETTSMEWGIDWRVLNVEQFITAQMSEEQKRAVLVFSSFNPNGYIRQQAAELLSLHHNTLPYIFLRLNDWVQNVRQSALAAVTEKMQSAPDQEIVSVLPFAEKLRRAGRCDYPAITAILRERINVSHKLLARGLMSEDIRARRFCLSMIADFTWIKETSLFDYIKKERDPFLRRIAFRLLLSAHVDGVKLSDQFLKDKYPPNRLLALQYLSDHNPSLAFSRAELLLLDKNSQVRSLARSIIGKDSNMDFHQYYREALAENTAVAIYGLGEVGSLEDCPLLEEYLKDHRISVIRGAMVSLMHFDPDRFALPVTELLASEHKGIVKTARLLLGKYRNYDYQRVYEILENASDENTKMKCALLLFQAPKWKSLIFTLMLIGSSNEKLEEMYQVQIRRWITYYNRSFQLVSQVQKAQIQELIAVKQHCLGPGMEKQLLFLL